MYKIVIAEDELFVRLGIKMSIDWEKLDMEVAADVENGQQALEAWEMLKPDIMITDIKMPLMDGISLIREIRKKDDRTRFIILSCLEEFQIVREAISMGVSDYVLKLTMTQEDMEQVLLKVRNELEVLDGRHLEKKSSENKNQFENDLRSWLYYRLDMRERYRQIFDEKFRAGWMRMVLLEIERYQECKKMFNDAYGLILDAVVENILSELLQNHTHILLIEKEGQSILILQEEQEKISDDLEKLLENIREIFGRYLKTGVSFGISRLGCGYPELGVMYQQCCQAMEKKFFIGTNRNLIYREEEQEKCKALIIRKMDRLIRSTQDEAEASRLGEAKEAFCEHENPTSIRQYFEHAISVQVGKILPDSPRRYQIIDTYTERLRMSQMMDEVIGIYQEAQKFLNEDSEEENSYLSKSVKDILLYIHEHYAEDISLNQIAQYVELSRTYVSGLFKKELGVNLMNYITNYRIEKAKELLRDTNLKSYEIAERVGFLDESYFSRSFKKITGQSPNAYKRGIQHT